MKYPELKPISATEYKNSKDRERVEAIKSDLLQIHNALTSDDEDNLRSTHIYIDGKYGAYVPEWGRGMYGYLSQCGFNYELLGKESLQHNLQLMRAKLEGYAIGFEKPSNRTQLPSNNVNVNVNNTNEINISVTFESVRQQIEDMTSLTDQETEEILSKIADLEKIVNSKDKKKSKWENAKSILVWLADKSFDVGMALLPLLLKLGE